MIQQGYLKKIMSIIFENYRREVFFFFFMGSSTHILTFLTITPDRKWYYSNL